MLDLNEEKYNKTSFDKNYCI